MKQEALFATEDAIRRVTMSNEDYVAECVAVIQSLAERKQTLTADDVKAILDERNVEAREPKAMGGAFRQAAKERLIRNSGAFVKSQRVECHSRPIAVWESLIYQEALPL